MTVSLEAIFLSLLFSPARTDSLVRRASAVISIYKSISLAEREMTAVLQLLQDIAPARERSDHRDA
jgi:hypothetical protein